MLYSPDSYGLGHVRRSISLAEAVLARRPESSCLLLTGAPRAHYFEYPEGCDYLKLPSVTKDELGSYVSRELDMTVGSVVKMRERLIRVSGDSFRPDVLLVDHSPLGLGGEIVSTLRRLGGGRSRTLRVLGLRDVIDEPDKVRATWRRERVIDALRRLYDLILVYGQRDVFDVVEQYGIPADVASKLEYVGYVPRGPRMRDPQSIRREFAPRTGRLVVVTLGGGGDGDRLLRAFLEGFEQLCAAGEPEFEVLAITGPLMSPRKRTRFEEAAQALPSLSVIKYSDDPPAIFHAADLVVSMGGYNTVCELACAGARSIIAPRTRPRREQWIRARILESRGRLQCIGEDPPDPVALMAQIRAGLERSKPEAYWGLDFRGPEQAAALLDRSWRAIRNGRRPRAATRG